MFAHEGLIMRDITNKSKLGNKTNKKKRTLKYFDGVLPESTFHGIKEYKTVPQVIGDHYDPKLAEKDGEMVENKLNETVNQIQEQEEEDKITSDFLDAVSFVYEGIFSDLLTINGKTKNDLIDYLKLNEISNLSNAVLIQYIASLLDRKEPTFTHTELKTLSKTIMEVKSIILFNGNASPPYISLILFNDEQDLKIKYHLENVTLVHQLGEDADTIFNNNLPKKHQQAGVKSSDYRFTIKAWMNAFRERYTYRSTNSSIKNHSITPLDFSDIDAQISRLLSPTLNPPLLLSDLELFRQEIREINRDLLNMDSLSATRMKSYLLLDQASIEALQSWYKILIDRIKLCQQQPDEADLVESLELVNLDFVKASTASDSALEFSDIALNDLSVMQRKHEEKRQKEMEPPKLTWLDSLIEAAEKKEEEPAGQSQICEQYAISSPQAVVSHQWLHLFSKLKPDQFSFLKPTIETLQLKSKRAIQAIETAADKNDMCIRQFNKLYLDVIQPAVKSGILRPREEDSVMLSHSVFFRSEKCVNDYSFCILVNTPEVKISDQSYFGKDPRCTTRDLIIQESYVEQSSSSIYELH